MAAAARLATKKQSRAPDHDQRRIVVAEIIRSERVSTQKDLLRALSGRGIDATQATLSRDLAWLKARRVSLPGGGTMYELQVAAAPDEEHILSVARDMVIGVDESLALVVVRTAAGAASVVADAIDRARLPSVSGTIAGDDTVFVAPSKRSSVAAVGHDLRAAWGKP